MNKLTIEQADKYFSYDPETGFLRWKINRFNRFGSGNPIAGKKAGWVTDKGYIKIGLTLDGEKFRHYLAHRIAWLLHYREFPSKEIDHINGVPWDNRICNLRLADRSQQCFNSPAQRHSSHGFKGLIFDPDKCKGGRWRARIQARGKRIHLGWFKTEGEAIEAYKKGMDLYHEGFSPDLTVRKQSFLLRPEPKTKEMA